MSHGVDLPPYHLEFGLHGVHVAEKLEVPWTEEVWGPGDVEAGGLC